MAFSLAGVGLCYWCAKRLRKSIDAFDPTWREPQKIFVGYAKLCPEHFLLDSKLLVGVIHVNCQAFTTVSAHAEPHFCIH